MNILQQLPGVVLYARVSYRKIIHRQAISIEIMINGEPVKGRSTSIAFTSILHHLQAIPQMLSVPPPLDMPEKALFSVSYRLSKNSVKELRTLRLAVSKSGVRYSLSNDPPCD